MVKDIVELYSKLEQEAADKAVAEVRNISKIEVGQVVRQGDIYIHRVENDHPHGKMAENHQLAEGNTQGSRHVADENAQVFVGTKAPQWAERAFLGPLVKSTVAFKIVHPEHAHVNLPAGTYQITHQMDARTLERVRD